MCIGRPPASLSSSQPLRCCHQLDPAAFTSYLHKYRNTICGRHPIAVMLQVRCHSHAAHKPGRTAFQHACLPCIACCRCVVQMVAHSADKFKLTFTCYDQSSKAVASSDSSVSYASAVVTAAP